MQDDLIFGALDRINNPPALNTWTVKFKDIYPTKFAATPDDAFVGARSMVKGMKLNWSTQCRKIKSRWGGGFLTTPTQAGETLGLLVIPRDNVEKYVQSISLLKVSEETAERVLTYKKDFPDFVNGQTLTCDDLKVMDYYLDSIEGVQQLVFDAMALQNQGVARHLAEVLHELLKCDSLSLSELHAADRIEDIAEIVSKNQHKIRRVAA